MSRFLEKLRNKVIPYRFSIKVRRRCVGLMYKIRHLLYALLPNLGIEIYRKDPLSVVSFCRNMNLEREVLDSSRFQVEYRAPFFESNPSAYVNNVTPDVYYAKLSNVDVIGVNDVIISDSFALNDKFDLPDADRIDFETNNVLRVGSDGYYIIGKRGEPISEAISLLGCESHNYYHWTFDLLAKMAYINMFEELASVPVLVDKAVASNQVYLDLLKRVDENNHPIVFVNSGWLRKVSVLHYFSFCTFYGVYYKPPFRQDSVVYAKPQAVIDMYRRLRNVGNEKNERDSLKRIFIARGKDKVKRLVNEDMVARKCMEAGFSIVDPGELELNEQIRLFSNAEWIIGDEGAAFVNIVFAGPEATMVCIMPESWGNRQFTTIANLSGVDSINLDATDLGYGRYHEMNLDYLERFLLSISKKDERTLLSEVTD